MHNDCWTSYLTKEIEAPEFVNRIIRLFDGPAQREAQRLAREALGEEPGNNGLDPLSWAVIEQTVSEIS